MYSNKKHYTFKKKTENVIKIHKLTPVTSLAIPDLSTAMFSAHYNDGKQRQTISTKPNCALIHKAASFM